MTAPDTAAAHDLLRRLGAADIRHPGGALPAHLERVRNTLAEWGTGPAVRLAGLCHAAYGTDGFDVALLDVGERDRLAAVIGAEAERLVYLYGSCDRRRTYPALSGPGLAVFHDRFTGTTSRPEHAAVEAFLAITFANELDVAAHNPALAMTLVPWLRAFVEGCRARVSPEVSAACAARLAVVEGR